VLLVGSFAASHVVDPVGEVRTLTQDGSFATLAEVVE